MVNKMATEYKKTFIKKDRTERTMRFVRLSELSMEDYDTYSIPPPNSTPSTKRNYAEGLELVWDLDANDFRCFNWNNVVD